VRQLALRESGTAPRRIQQVRSSAFSHLLMIA